MKGMEKEIKIIKEKMKALINGGDEECDHVDADCLLCELLTLLGHEDIVQDFEEIEKWYA